MGFISPSYPNIKLTANKKEEWTECEPPSQICSKNSHCNAPKSANTNVDSK